MALAIIQPQESDAGHVQMRVHIGTNRYFAYAIGNGKDRVVSSGGVRRLDEPVHRSPLMGPLPEHRRGRTTLELPRELFDRDNRHVQLFSFRTKDLEGPAISDIVEVPLGTARGPALDDLPGPYLEPLLESHGMSALITYENAPARSINGARRAAPAHPQPRGPAQVAAMNYREAPMSEAMFIESIVGAIGSALPSLGSFLASNLPAIVQAVGPALNSGVSSVIPMISNMLPGLLSGMMPGGGGGGAGGGGGSGRTPAPPTAPAPAPSPGGAAPVVGASPGITPETIRAISELIQGALGGRAPSPTNVNINQNTTASPQTTIRTGDSTSNAELLAQQQSLARTLRRGGMSQAQALPLAALIPLIPQLLSAVKDFAQIGLQADRQQMEHLERLNPGVNPQDLLALMGTLSATAPRVVRARRSPRAQPRSLAMANARVISRRSGISQAQALPLAALIPLIPQLLNSVKDLAAIGIAADRQLQEHLERLNPGVNPQDLLALMGTLSLGGIESAGKPRFRTSGLVTITLGDVTPTTLGGREWLLYRHGHDLTFPIDVEAPRTLKKATLHVALSDPRTKKTILTRRTPLENIEAGRLPDSPTIRAQELSRIKEGADAILTVSLVWKDKKGKPIGASVTHAIKLIGACTFNRFEDAGELIPLNDVQVHRDFWHRLWSGELDENRRRLALECKYYFAMEPERASNARMETVLDLEEDEAGRQTGRLRSGMVLSPDILNALIPRIAPSERELTIEELAALRTKEFAARAGQVARSQIKFRAARGSSVALWMYPEVKLHTLILNRAEGIADTGHIPELTETAVKFPLPALVHLIGTSTEGED